jgi:hypothetical protein
MQIDAATRTIRVDKSEAVILRDEANAFLEAHRNYFPCPENLEMINNYLAQRELPPTYPNLTRAYEELTEAGALHLSPPDPRQLGGTDPHRRPPKPKIAPYHGSHFDRTEINRLKAQIALMSASEIREFLAVNNWSDWPPFLRS